jgi:transcriptional regulator with XRE-family HTH domain
VSVAGTSPTARQRELGARLRGFRIDRGMTVEHVANELLCSATKISRLETGARRPSLRDVRDLCALYELDETTSAELMSLARGAREPGWWSTYEDLNLDPYIGLEQEAVAITCYSMSYIPGLLQTAGYADGIIKTIAPKMEAHIAGQRVEARMRRQQVLEKANRPRYDVLLDEAVMHRGVGGPGVMAGQLDRVLEVMRLGRAAVQVIPFSAGAYAALEGYFSLLEFAENSDLRPMVFVEGLSTNLYLERESDVARYREAIEYLHDRALNLRRSAELITRIRDNYASE